MGELVANIKELEPLVHILKLLEPSTKVAALYSEDW
jgi:hypothetical protein